MNKLMKVALMAAFVEEIYADGPQGEFDLIEEHPKLGTSYMRYELALVVTGLKGSILGFQ